MMFSLRSRVTAAIAILGVLGLATTACATSAPAAEPGDASTPPAGLDALVAEAKSEGELNLVWGEGILGGTASAPQLAEGFRDYYDLPDFAVNYTPGPGFTQLAAALGQEVAAGQTATSDLYLGYAPQFANLLDLDYPVFETIDWSWAENIPAEAVGGDGAGVSVATSIPVITYNSETVKSPPTSMADLLDSEWKGRIASTPYASNFHYFAAMNGQDEVLEYLRDFSQQIGGLIQCTQHDRLLTGEFDILALDCDQSTVTSNERDGGPLRFVIPSDAAMLSYFTMGIPVNSAHPAAAKLWINYLMTREAQDLLWEISAGDSTFVDGSHMSELVEEQEADGVEFSSWDLNEILESGKFPNADYLAQQVAILSGTE